MLLHLVPRSLQYLEQVALLGSIQAASRELGISASAIHRQIAAVEDAIGESLFDRDAKGMTLAPVGKLVLDMARDWRLDSAKLWSTIQAHRGVEHGHIRVAAMDSMVNGLVLEMVGELNRRFPRIQAEIEVTSPDSAVKGVLNGDFDFAAVANAAPHDNLVFHWSREFPLGCIAAPDHPIAAMSSISLAEFVSYPVAFQGPSLTIRKLLEARHGWIYDRAEQFVVVNSIQLMKLLAVSGRYVAVTSELDAGPELASGRLKFVPIGDEDIFTQSMSIISNAKMQMPPACRKVVDMAVEIIGDLTSAVPA